MATRTIYARVRIILDDDRYDEITDEQVCDFYQECEYDFPSTEDMKVQSTFWCDVNY